MKPQYIKHKIANLIAINKIVTIHYFEFAKNFVFNGESHDFWEMVYVDSGEIEVSANKKRHTLRQGNVIFHKPNEFHTLKTGCHSHANVFVISFVCSSEAMKFFKGKTMLLPGKLRKYISVILEEFKETFKEMDYGAVKLETKENPPIGSQQIIRINLEQLLIMLIRQEQEKRDIRIFPSKESMENHLVSYIMQEIEKRLYEKISVEELCAQLNYSRAYLSKIFKMHSGYTISEYITKMKIQEAKRLIREGKYNFTQISDKLAFDNPHYFSAVFKRVTNMTPGSYKNSAIRY